MSLMRYFFQGAAFIASLNQNTFSTLRGELSPLLTRGVLRPRPRPSFAVTLIREFPGFSPKPRMSAALREQTLAFADLAPPRILACFRILRLR